jgi:hypothetical protein
VIKYAGSFMLRRIGSAPVTCLWINPSGPPNRLMPAAMIGGRIPASSSASGSTR